MQTRFWIYNGQFTKQIFTTLEYIIMFDFYKL